MSGRALAQWHCRAVVQGAPCGADNSVEHPTLQLGRGREVKGHRLDDVPTCYKCGAPWVTDDEQLAAKGLA